MPRARSTVRVRGSRVTAGVLGATSWGLAACTTIIPGTMPHDVRRDAIAVVHQQCDATPVDPRFYGPGIVLRVEPRYVYTLGGPNGREAHFAGADLHVMPLPGLTVELLQRSLSCHGAQVLLGRTSAPPDDPYGMSDAWVNVDVRSGSGDFVVTLSSDQPDAGRALFDRAKAFAARALSR